MSKRERDKRRTIHKTYHLSGRNLALAEKADAVDVAGVDADGLASVLGQMTVPVCIAF